MPCIPEDAKTILREAFPDNAALGQFLESGIETCAITKTKRARDPNAPPRKRSAYQEFVSECLRTKMAGKGFDASGSAMKSCAIEWNNRPKAVGPAPRPEVLG